MTCSEFKTLVNHAASEPELTRLMSQYWPDITGTPREFEDLRRVVLQQYLDVNEKPGDAQNRGASIPAELSELQIAQLVSMFEMHGGRVPARELIADNFNPAALEASGYIMASPVPLERGTYLIGAKLKEEVGVAV